MQQWYWQVALASVDAAMAVIPRARPSQDSLKSSKLVSHRGEHDNKDVAENTFEAFDQALECGVWGIETDVRWTSDLVPVIHHDPDTNRVFDVNLQIAQTEFAELRSRIPGIPTLEELVARYGRKAHIMLELKEERFPELEKQKATLTRLLTPLEPCEHYHILALDAGLFETFDISPRMVCLPVAGANMASLSKIALERGYGGITGHFLLANSERKQLHEAAGQKIGTGFPRSRFCLYRELNRNVEWIFTNDAVKLQNIVNDLSG